MQGTISSTGCTADGVATAPGVEASSSTNQANSGSGAVASSTLAPIRDAAGIVVQCKAAYQAQLDKIERKAPLLEECRRFGLKGVSKANLGALRKKLVEYWYRTAPVAASAETSLNINAARAHATRQEREETSAPTAPPSSGHAEGHELDLIDPILRPPRASSDVQPPPPLLGPAFEYRPTRAPAVSHSEQGSPRRSEGDTIGDPDYPPLLTLPLSREEFEDDRRACAGSDANPEYHEHSQLLQDLGIDAPVAEQVLQYDTGIDPDGEEEEPEGDEDEDGMDPEDDCGGEMEDESPEERTARIEAFRRKTRVDAAQEKEANRRAGGLQTQKGLVKFWEEFIQLKLEQDEVQDKIVDEHSVLLFIKWNANRCKRTRRGAEIPGTLIGASQLKKHFFSVFRIRKEQEAYDPTLRDKRPITSGIVWDAIKTAMDKAVRRVRSGMDVGPEEDVPDIIHNTFLDQMSQEDLAKIGRGFLLHRNLRSVINGHFAFCEQMATGNRGDDLRSLRLCEMQPYEMPHPNNVQTIPSVLGLQGEEKAGLKGMQSKVNPVYSVLIAHKLPERCPLSALGFLLHYLFDVADIITKEDIDFKWNKSFRPIRVLHSGNDAKRPMASQGLFNLWSGSYAKGGVNYRIKQHLARHLLPYLQRQFGVPADETSRMGWKRGQSFYDTYAPALPKQAILAAHGFSMSEPYNPAWTHVNVPERFLAMVCPMAEGIIESVKGLPNMQGTTYFWEMVISLRPYIFQSAAAIMKICPSSRLFSLPALAHPDVQVWMKTTFQEQLTVCEAQAGNVLALGRIQDAMIGNSLTGYGPRTDLEAQQWRAVIAEQSMAIIQLQAQFNRRTQFLSPTQGFCPTVYESRAEGSATQANVLPIVRPRAPDPSTPTQSAQTPVSTIWDTDGVYVSPTSGLRAFVSDSPSNARDSRPRTQVDLVLPRIQAFARPDETLLFPPSLGRQGVTWTQIFEKIKQPKYLWEVYQPAKPTLDSYGSVDALWSLFSIGEPLYDTAGNRTGMKPPLILLEETFGNGAWRAGISAADRKKWQRFREIPEWILKKSRERAVSAQGVIEELEAIRREKKITLNGLMKVVKTMREEEAEAKAHALANESGSESTGNSVTTGQKRRAKPRDPRRKRIKRVDNA